MTRVRDAPVRPERTDKGMSHVLRRREEKSEGSRLHHTKNGMQLFISIIFLLIVSDCSRLGNQVTGAVLSECMNVVGTFSLTSTCVSFHLVLSSSAGSLLQGWKVHVPVMM